MAVLKADPKTRLIFIIFILILIILLPLGFMEFNEFLNQKTPLEAINILKTLLALAFLSCLPIAALFYYTGNRILKAGQFPLPGAKLLMDKEIITGDKARYIALKIKKISILFAFLCLYLAYYFYYSILNDIKIIKNSSSVFTLKTSGISVAILAAFFGISLLICKWIDSYLSKNQTKEKEIKPKLITRDKKALFMNIMDSVLATGFTMMLIKPCCWISEVVFRHFFPFPIKGTIVEILAVVYIAVSSIIAFVLLIYTWRWLKKYLYVPESP